MSTCEKCKELLGKYATTPQFGCHDCWKIVQDRIDKKNEEIINKSEAVIDLCDEVERLKSELAQVKEVSYARRDEIWKLDADIVKLKAELKQEREVVDFYADPENQVAPIYKPTGEPGADFTQPYRMDKGKRARIQQAKRTI